MNIDIVRHNVLSSYERSSLKTLSSPFTQTKKMVHKTVVRPSSLCRPGSRYSRTVSVDSDRIGIGTSKGPWDGLLLYGQSHVVRVPKSVLVESIKSFGSVLHIPWLL